MKFIRNTTLVIWMLVSLLSLALSASIWAISQTMRVATLSKAVATQAIQNRNQIARLKAKAKLRRVVLALPAIGAGAALYFEDSDRREWLLENPGKTNSDYACEMGALMAEVMDEFLVELPKRVRLPERMIPKCENEAD